MDKEILALKKAYKLLQTVEALHEYGPMRAYDADIHQPMQQLWYDVINPLIAPVIKNTKRVEEGRYITEAHSPWHAYFYLRAQQQYVYRGGQPLYQTELSSQPAPAEHMYFRGQRCKGWNFQSSLSRRDPATQSIERKAVIALDEYFRQHFLADANVAAVTAICFAQHYGIATNLTDITPDPDIAIWFATHPVGEPCPSGEQRALVRAMTWAAQEQGARTFFLIPPPFINNVYLQHGLFADTEQHDGILHGKLTLEVEFPRETAGGEFQVIRNGEAVDIWPTPETYEKELVSWAREVAAAYTDEAAIRQAVRKAEQEDSLPDYWLHKELWDVEKHVQDWFSILDWYLSATCVTSMPGLPTDPQPIRYSILQLKVQSLVKANPTFFRMLMDVFPGGKDGSYATVIEHILSIAREETGTLEQTVNPAK